MPRRASQANLIKFADGAFASLRERLLADLSTESFAVLLAKSSPTDPTVLRVIGVRYPSGEDLESRSRGHITPKKDFIFRILAELGDRWDIDAVLDVHTHPFSENKVQFSGVDDGDEIRFSKFLSDRFPGIHYGSIVLSQSQYSARLWRDVGGKLEQVTAEIRTQSPRESAPSSDVPIVASINPKTDGEIFSRTEAAIGTAALRHIMSGQKILLVGLGGLGSIIAENLVQIGFSNLTIVDPDTVELSNLSRLVGAFHGDALKGARKAHTLRRHLRRINPNVRVEAIARGVEDPLVGPHAATSHWIVVSTDNHASRLAAQELSQEYFTPLLSVGVNITASTFGLSDVSGEVILCKNGAGFCLNCIGRINPVRVAAEMHPSDAIRSGIVQGGYVSGANVTEPAVKTLNSILAAIAVDVLVNEYTQRQSLHPILVYENNDRPSITEEYISFEERQIGCYSCGIAESVEGGA